MSGTPRVQAVTLSGGGLAVLFDTRAYRHQKFVHPSAMNPTSASVNRPAGGSDLGAGRGRREVHPGGDLDREGDQGAADLVIGEVVQQQVHQAGVIGAPDPVYVAGAATV